MQTLALNQASAAARKPLAKRAYTAVLRFFETRHQRRQLSELSPEQLCDIGLSVHDVNRELKRPAWDAPSQFLR